MSRVVDALGKTKPYKKIKNKNKNQIECNHATILLLGIPTVSLLRFIASLEYHSRHRN